MKGVSKNWALDKGKNKGKPKYRTSKIIPIDKRDEQILNSPVKNPITPRLR
jgi:hypothetical protein